MAPDSAALVEVTLRCCTAGPRQKEEDADTEIEVALVGEVVMTEAGTIGVARTSSVVARREIAE